jgi:hypothetical protein
MNNSQLFIDINEVKKDVKSRGGWLAVFFAFLGVSVFNNLRNEKYFERIFNYIDFGLRVIGMLAIVMIFWYLIFRRKSKRNLIINDIETIEVDKQEFETAITIRFHQKREIELNFRNLENQIEPFLEALKKRNSRVQIKPI